MTGRASDARSPASAVLKTREMTTRPDAEELTPTQIAELRAQLTSKQADLRRVRSVRRDEPRAAQPDGMDAATDATADAEIGLISEHDERLRIAIETALAKFDAGTYGVSELSGEPIGFPRLRAVPWARLTVEEEELNERRNR